MWWRYRYRSQASSPRDCNKPLGHLPMQATDRSAVLHRVCAEEPSTREDTSKNFDGENEFLIDENGSEDHSDECSSKPSPSSRWQRRVVVERVPQRRATNVPRLDRGREGMWRRYGEHLRVNDPATATAQWVCDHAVAPGIRPLEREVLVGQAVSQSMMPQHFIVRHRAGQTQLLHPVPVNIPREVSQWKQAGREYVRPRSSQWDAYGREFTKVMDNPAPCPQWKQYGREWVQQRDEAELAPRYVSSARVVSRPYFSASRAESPPETAPAASPSAGGATGAHDRHVPEVDAMATDAEQERLARALQQAKRRIGLAAEVGGQVAAASFQ